MTQKINIVLTGVGGQGVITAAHILGSAAVQTHIHVLASEIHGMAQRGGAVMCTVRMGDVSGSLVPLGMAHVLLSTEPVEALRNICYVNKKTKILTDINPTIPSTVAVGGETYPPLDKIFKELESAAHVYKIDAVKIARDAGSLVTRNIVMLGALTAVNVLPFDEHILLETILKNVPPKFQKMNTKAFMGGKNSILKHY